MAQLFDFDQDGEIDDVLRDLRKELSRPKIREVAVAKDDPEARGRADDSRDRAGPRFAHCLKGTLKPCASSRCYPARRRSSLRSVWAISWSESRMNATTRPRRSPGHG